MNTGSGVGGFAGLHKFHFCRNSRSHHGLAGGNSSFFGCHRILFEVPENPGTVLCHIMLMYAKGSHLTSLRRAVSRRKAPAVDGPPASWRRGPLQVMSHQGQRKSAGAAGPFRRVTANSEGCRNS